MPQLYGNVRSERNEALRKLSLLSTEKAKLEPNETTNDIRIKK
jgi:hypothetical protein